MIERKEKKVGWKGYSTRRGLKNCVLVDNKKEKERWVLDDVRRKMLPPDAAKEKGRKRFSLPSRDIDSRWACSIGGS